MPALPGVFPERVMVSLIIKDHGDFATLPLVHEPEGLSHLIQWESFGYNHLDPSHRRHAEDWYS